MHAAHNHALKLTLLLAALALFAPDASSADKPLRTADPLDQFDPGPNNSRYELQRPAAVASDRLEDSHPDRNHSNPRLDEAQAAAQELLRQRGSVVDNRQLLGGFREAPQEAWHQPRPSLEQPMPADGNAYAWPTPAEYQQPVPGPSLRRSEPNKVSALRDAAWQLETTAHRLEGIDLYEQADALREVAQRMRRDARKIKQTLGNSNPTRLRAGRISDPRDPQPRD